MDDQGIRDNNARHNEALAVVNKAIKAGAKYTVIPSRQRSDVLPGKFKKVRVNSSNAPILAGLNPTEKFRVTLSHYKELTRRDLIEHTGLAPCTISRSARILEDEGFLTRGPSGVGIGREVLFKLAGDL